MLKTVKKAKHHTEISSQKWGWLFVRDTVSPTQGHLEVGHPNTIGPDPWLSAVSILEHTHYRPGGSGGTFAICRPNPHVGDMLHAIRGYLPSMDQTIHWWRAPTTDGCKSPSVGTFHPWIGTRSMNWGIWYMVQMLSSIADRHPPTGISRIVVSATCLLNSY